MDAIPGNPKKRGKREKKEEEKKKLKISHHHAAIPHAAKCIMQTVSTSRASLDPSPGITNHHLLPPNKLMHKIHTLLTSQRPHQRNKTREASISHAEPG
jgi:hypothetical protein